MLIKELYSFFAACYIPYQQLCCLHAYCQGDAYVQYRVSHHVAKPTFSSTRARDKKNKMITELEFYIPARPLKEK